MKLILYSNLRMSFILYSFILSLFILSFLHSASAQGIDFTPNAQQADSLKFVLQHTDNDTQKMVICKILRDYTIEHSDDRASNYNKNQIELAQKLHQKIWEADGLNWEIGHDLAHDYDKALKLLETSKSIAEDPENEKNVYIEPYKAKIVTPHTKRLHLLADIYVQYCFTHRRAGDDFKAIESLNKGIKVAETIDDEVMLSKLYTLLALNYRISGKMDSVLVAAEKSIYYKKKSGDKAFLHGNYMQISEVYKSKKDFVTAKKYLLKGLEVSQDQNSDIGAANIYISLAYLFEDTHQPDSTILYFKKSKDTFVKWMGDGPGAYGDIYMGISNAFKEKGNTDSAYYYLQRSVKANQGNHQKEVDDLKKYQNFFLKEQKKLKDAEKKNIQLQNYALLGGLGLVSMIGFVLYRNNKQKQKANIVLQTQKTELVQTLAKLTSAQNQLIQSEKLASLGELTAGIAHEIQNPLNFVNNFSKMSIELANEVRDEITKIEMAQNDKEYIGDIIKDLNSNQTKIAFHGERASSIVKGMLEHARHDTGTRQLTDINKLCDEYFRLAYHGLRAKHKDFTCTMESRLDPSIQPIEIVPQDIGRVILNIINNAFYAVNERKNKAEDPDFVPTVSIVTKHIVDANLNGIEIRITDNGTGIPRGIREKIFHPFFTTKPTGTGNTGLGLSLSYDIITKGHGGTLKVESTEGLGTEMIIQLPLG